MTEVLYAPVDPVTASAAADATRQWIDRVVIGLNLCPFAKAVQVKRQIRYSVTAARTADELLAELTREVDLLITADPSEIDTTLLIHPGVMQEFLDYHFFLAEANALLQRQDTRRLLQIAGFHPDYQFARIDRDDMANFTNRSPHPMLHLLRESSVDRAVSAFPDAAEIFDSNVKRLRALGPEGLRNL